MRRHPLLILLLAAALTTAAAAAAVGDGEHNENETEEAEDVDVAALLAFKSTGDLDGRLHFPTPARNCCRWQGVQCSEDGRVTRLVLENLGLRGRLVFVNNDTDATGSSGDGGGRGGRRKSVLYELRVLSLKNNSLGGPIPDLSYLHNLKALFLSDNLFSGSIPTSFLVLHRLRTLDLSYNRLSGPVPAFNSSSLISFNVSANNLSGPVPPTAILLSFGTSAFSRNPALCGTAVRRECNNSNRYFFSPSSTVPSSVAPTEAMAERGGPSTFAAGKSSSHKNDNKKSAAATAAAAVFTVGALLATGLVAVLLLIKIKRRKQESILSPHKGVAEGAATVDAMESRSGENGPGGRSNDLAAAAAISEDKAKRLGKSGCLVFCAGEPSVYTLEQLMRASAEMLGRGTVGTTYKAVLDNRLIVTVKRLDASKMSTPGKDVFQSHMEAVGRLRHPNLVPLRTYFQAKEERLLVYDYQPNGSLYALVHGSRSVRPKPLHWTSCVKIAEDVAQGLAYIHQASRLVHGNLKSTNVLLGSDFEACITDNCLAFLVEPSAEEDLGHRAPEAQDSNRHLTPKSDIYSFGILLLELLTGKPPPHHHPFPATTDLPAWVQSVREDDCVENEKLMMLVNVASACVKSSPERRPTTWQVLKMIQEVREAEMEEDNTDLDSPGMN